MRPSTRNICIIVRNSISSWANDWLRYVVFSFLFLVFEITKLRRHQESSSVAHLCKQHKPISISILFSPFSCNWIVFNNCINTHVDWMRRNEKKETIDRYYRLHRLVSKVTNNKIWLKAFNKTRRPVRGQSKGYIYIYYDLNILFFISWLDLDVVEVVW